MVLDAAGRCAGCRARDRLLAQLRQQVAELQEDCRRLQRRLARIKKDNDRLRAELDEMRRQAHRQANPFRRSKLKKRKKKPGRRRGQAGAEARPPPCALRPSPSILIGSSTCRVACVLIAVSSWSIQARWCSIKPTCRPLCPSSPSSISRPASAPAVVNASRGGMPSKPRTPSALPAIPSARWC